MSCGGCSKGGWVIPETFYGDVATPLIPMRCECMGGPEGLANIVQKDDPDCAARIRAQFKNISANAYRTGQAKVNVKTQVRVDPVKVVSHAEKSSEDDLW